MKHEEINRFNLIDRYLMGKLLAEESARFEEHFVDCPQCIADLQTTKSFMQDLRFVAAEQVSQIDHHQPKRAFGHFWQTLLRSPLALAIGCLLIAAAISAFWVINYTWRLRAEVNQAENLSKQWQQRYDNEQQSAISAEKRYQETEAQRAEQLREMEARLREEAQRTKMTAEPGRRTHPEGNLSIFVLTSLRGGGPDTSEAINPITIPRSSAMVGLSIQLEGEMRFKNYHIKILDNRKKLIWKSRDSTPDPESNSLSIVLKREFFHPGDYYLIVESSENSVIGNYPFSIIKAR